MARRELRGGEAPAYGAEFRAYDVVLPVEDWGLHSAEIGWAAFLFQRDYRDYYLSKGVAGRLFVQPARLLHLTTELRRDWPTRRAEERRGGEGGRSPGSPVSLKKKRVRSWRRASGRGMQ